MILFFKKDKKGWFFMVRIFWIGLVLLVSCGPDRPEISEVDSIYGLMQGGDEIRITANSKTSDLNSKSESVEDSDKNQDADNGQEWIFSVIYCSVESILKDNCDHSGENLYADRVLHESLFRTLLLQKLSSFYSELADEGTRVLVASYFEKLDDDGFDEDLLRNAIEKGVKELNLLKDRFERLREISGEDLSEGLSEQLLQYQKRIKEVQVHLVSNEDRLKEFQVGKAATFSLVDKLVNTIKSNQVHDIQLLSNDGSANFLWASSFSKFDPGVYYGNETLYAFKDVAYQKKMQVSDPFIRVIYCADAQITSYDEIESKCSSGSKEYLHFYPYLRERGTKYSTAVNDFLGEIVEASANSESNRLFKIDDFIAEKKIENTEEVRSEILHYFKVDVADLCEWGKVSDLHTKYVRTLKAIASQEANCGRWSELTSLDLNKKGISDVSSLANLVSLKVLLLNSNYIDDVSSLASLVNLTTLRLPYNYINDVSSLASLVNLTELELYGNQVTDVSSLSSLVNLTELNFHGNRIIKDEAHCPPYAPSERIAKFCKIYIKN